MPETIEAICFPGDSREAEADARRAHAQYLAEFPHAAKAVPLLRLDIQNAEPFSLARGW